LEGRDRALILVVDDQLFMRRSATDWLEEAGFAVETADDGAQGLLAFQRVHPDLVLLDVVMPVMDGFAACSALRHLPEGRHVPILMMTGLDDARSIQDAYRAGATDFIHKPINGLVLGYRVRYMLRAARTAERLRRSEARLANAQRMANLGHWELDPDQDAWTGSEQLEQILGSRPSTWSAFLACIHPEDRLWVGNELDRSLNDRKRRNADFRVIRGDGTERVVHQEIEVAAPSDGRPPQVSGAVLDITDLRRAQEQVRYLAYYDGLTGLPNRRFAVDRLRLLTARARRLGGWIATLLVGVDHFKRINDTMGHAAGDELLQELAGRLLRCLGQSAAAEGVPPQAAKFDPFVGRFGGDELVVFLSDVGRVEDAARVARRIVRALRKPFAIENREVFVTASIGISLFPFDGSDPELLLRNAASAMAHAKAKGLTSYEFYTVTMNDATRSDFLLESNLRKAVERGEFTLHFQPQMDLASGQIVGAEALIRWDSPELGRVMPLEFIPLAEETGLIFPIGDWVLRTACTQAMAWRDTGLPPLRMAVNVSARQFSKDGFTQTIARALKHTGLDPTCLDSELTESTVMEDVDSAILSLREMKAMGLKVSVDDFGTGYSSLSYLRRFPLDALKIDRSFLEGLPENAEHVAITSAIIAMAKTLNLRVIAEGVESREQLAFLRMKGCDEAQGNFLSFALPADEFVHLVRDTWNASAWC
jgi:diguanylate cyclase (GGDEF)-like protein